METLLQVPLIWMLALDDVQRKIRIDPSAFMSNCIGRNVEDVSDQAQRDAGMKLCACLLNTFQSNSRNQEFIELLEQDREALMERETDICKGNIVI